jgi:hypothetical protein
MCFTFSEVRSSVFCLGKAFYMDQSALTELETDLPRAFFPDHEPT